MLLDEYPKNISGFGIRLDTAAGKRDNFGYALGGARGTFFLDTFGYFWIRLDTFGNVWIRLDTHREWYLLQIAITSC